MIISKKDVWSVLKLEYPKAQFYQNKLNFSYSFGVEPDNYLASPLLFESMKKLHANAAERPYFFDWVSFVNSALGSYVKTLKDSSLKEDIKFILDDFDKLKKLKSDGNLMNDTIDGVLADAVNHYGNIGKSWNQRTYSVDEALSAFFELRNKQENELTSLEMEKLRFFLNRLVSVRNPFGIFERGSIAYTGGYGYPQDYGLALKYFIEAGENSIDQGFTNAGYIYYYDRLNTGKPDYEKAFYYFSQAAFSGNVNAMYKISDMLKHGKGVSKNLPNAFRMIGEVYPESYQLYVVEQRLEGYFPQLSLRLALFHREGEATFKDNDLALIFLLEGRYVLKEKLLKAPTVGDIETLQLIEKNIHELNELLQYPGPQNSSLYTKYFNLMLRRFHNEEIVKVHVKSVSHQTEKITVSLTFKKPLLVTNPRRNTVEMSKTVVIGLVGSFLENIDGKYNSNVIYVEDRKLYIGKDRKLQFKLLYNALYLLTTDHIVGTDFDTLNETPQSVLN